MESIEKLARKLPHFRSRAFLAPMAGITDAAMRRLCAEMGAGLVVTELTSIHAVVARHSELKKYEKEISEFVQFSEAERPNAVQLFGSNVEMLKRAATIIEPYFDIIDYNMGCPALHITNQMAGAALLMQPQKVAEIFRALVGAVKKPVTVKMRCGRSGSEKMQFLQIAKIAQEEGLSMVTLHPRTVEQGYSGRADWPLIGMLKKKLKIPVCGNGDIERPEDAERMLQETGCDYVMIGRGAAKNPFIFRQINSLLETGAYIQVSVGEKVEALFRYMSYSEEYKINVANIKMQAMNFTKGALGSSIVRSRLAQAQSIDEIRQILRENYMGSV